ncbi:MAG: MBOAT family protein [Vicinamibacteria bacterium]|nr:MBOAT family protein [Vicinamibacteria bacterium]
MVFSSHLFVYYFLPAALFVYYALPRRARHLWLTTASYAFYGWANPAFMGLMLLSTLIDYVCGWRLGASPRDERRPRAWLAVSLVSNLSLLGFFKYFNFAVDSYAALLTGLGLERLRPDVGLRVVLPLGISFYTFQSMSYTFDIYRGRTKPLKNIVDFACYVSLFPQLVAGPIIRFSEIADQLRHRTHTTEKFARGAAFFSLGMAKKVLLANPCGFVADAAFDAVSLPPLDAWAGVLAYAFQIYFDFSGYSDMAIGLGLMLGFVFPKNFDSPYHAESLTDFWRRWHISLSTWLRDYLYHPLGGNRKGPRRTYVNLAIVMLLGGLWHGAAWNFVVWGGIHGVWLAMERAMGKRSLYRRLPRPGRVALTFVGVLVTWVFFRAPDLAAAGRYLSAMAGLAEVRPGAALVGHFFSEPYYVLSLVIAAFVTWGCPQTWDWSRRLTLTRGALALGCLALSLVAMASQGYNPFIYFIF